MHLRAKYRAKKILASCRRIYYFSLQASINLTNLYQNRVILSLSLKAQNINHPVTMRVGLPKLKLDIE